MDGVTKTVFTLCMALFSIQAGAHMASLIRPHIRPLPLPNKTVRFTISTISVLMYVAAFPAYFRLPSIYRHQATAALLFSFPGTLTRYLLSINLNTRLKLFPLGTFTANMLGTALLGTFRVLQSKPTPVSPNACALLQGLSDGYCGCLTTVSTFAAEVKTLKEWKAWLYVALSWTGGQLLLLVIQGSSFWAGNVSKSVSCRFV
jgi:fluoride exporter